ncbi:MAG: hypothetical protein K2K46_11980 [Lachnospiraceae bacterium]|nr:hypothetical protein [Lachnospiraceae bacterium]
MVKIIADKKLNDKSGKKLNYSRLIDLLFIVLIFIVCLWDVGSLERIRVVDDGFCYWGIAANISGYDWSDLISASAYYSYGYSLILVPLFWLNRLGLSMALIYRIAIVLNACFLSGCYLMALYMLRELFKDIPDWLKQIISLFVTLYIGNTAQMGLAWPEVFLCFMFWCVIVFLYRVIKNPGYLNILGLAATSAELFAAHMRTIGVVIAVCLVIFSFFVSRRKEINKKYIFYTLALFVFFFSLVFIFKYYVTNYIYLGTAVNSSNNIQANVNRVGRLMSLRGILDLAVSAIGKFYYISAATFILALIGALTVLFCIAASLKKRGKTSKGEKWQLKEWMMVFALLSFLAEIGIESIFNCKPFFRTMEAVVRDDALAFGRYADFVQGPMIILGIWAVCRIKEHYKEIILGILISIGSSLIIQFFYDILAFRKGTSTVGFRFAASPWLAIVADGHKTDFACYVMLLSIGILLIMCIERLIPAFKWYSFGAILLVLAAVWSVCGIAGGMEYTESKINKKKAVDTVAKIIETTGHDVPVYMVGGANTEVKILQWLLANRSIHTCETEDINEIDTAHAVILGNSSNTEVMSEISETLDFLYDSGNISVFANPGSEYYNDISSKAEEMAREADPTINNISLADVSTELSYTKVNGSLYYNYEASDGGYMTGNMGVQLQDGIYEFTIDVRAQECEKDTEIGYITVGDSSGNIQYTQVLNANDFMEKARQNIKVYVEVKDWEEPFIGFYTYGNAAVRIYNISYRKKEGNLQLDSEEMLNIAEFVRGQDKKEIYYIDSDNSALTGFPRWEYGKLNYLPGKMLEFKTYFEEAYYLVEKTDMDVINVFRNEMQEVLETEGYMVFVATN